MIDLAKLTRWRALILDGTPLAAVREIEIAIAELTPKKK